MHRTVSRFLYRCLLRLHPHSFRSRFGHDMLWIFDEVTECQSVLPLFADGFVSLARQWVVRGALEKLFIGDLALAPSLGASGGELFAWERIASPETSLPIPRMLQGCVASLAFFALLSTFALETVRPANLRARRHTSTDSSRVQKRVRVAPQANPSDAFRGEGNSQAEAVVAGVAADGNVTEDLEPDPNSPFATQLVAGAKPPSQAPQVWTAQYDNARTGANLNEKTLTPANVSAAQFGKLFTFKVDGDVYAQPLYLPDVEVPGKGRHNVLFVATENDSVYAFDADGASTDPLWHASLASSKNGARPLSERDTSCFFIVPKVGITSTPVIDRKTGTLYVLARTKESKGMLSADEYKQRLHALAITTGAEKVGGPVEINASLKRGGAAGSSAQIDFDPQRENPRAALLLANDMVYLTWGSSCDVAPYYGWVISYDARSLAQKAVFNTSPDKSLASIWQGDAGPAADKDGNVFVVTGNGEFDAANNGRDYGDSVLKLGSGAQSLKLLDYFTPSNQVQLNDRDNDLGSSGPVLLPDQPGPHPHLLVTAGKEGKIYLIDRDHMGKYQPGDDPHAVQTIAASHGAFGAMAYWNQHVFFIGSENRVQDFAVNRGQLKLKATGPNRFLDSGAIPVISSNGTENAILWAAASKNWDEPPGRPAILYAYDATDVNRLLYNTEQKGARDRAGVALRFAMPTVVNGKVYLGAKDEVDVYGLLPQH